MARMRKSIALTLVATAIGTVLSVPQALPAQAASCNTVPYIEHYKFSNFQSIDIGTNVASAYIPGPATLTFTTTKTAQANISFSYNVGAEANVIVAKVNNQYGVAVGASWSESQTWTYTKNVPSGKTARLRLYHEGTKFDVRKYVWSWTECKMVQKYMTTVRAPKSEDINVFKFEYK